jgi:hypothetical protein
LRDGVKNEANKLLSTYRDRRGNIFSQQRNSHSHLYLDQIDQHLSRIETLNSLINTAEEDMVFLKQRYERAVKDRNTVGIHLLDRNDELCILYERLNIQTGIMNNGEKALAEREDEIRNLKIVESELIRRVELKKKMKPEAIDVRITVNDLKAELEHFRDRVIELSAKMESPEDPERCKDLKGIDPEQSELIEKIRRLELMLAEKEV